MSSRRICCLVTGKSYTYGKDYYDKKVKDYIDEDNPVSIDNTIERVLNFNPESTRDDGSTVGIKGFTERVMADTRFAKLDARKKLFEESEKKKQTTFADAEQAVQIADTDNFDTEFGIDYNGRVTLEHFDLNCSQELVEKIAEEVFKLFVETECPEEEISE